MFLLFNFTVMSFQEDVGFIMTRCVKKVEHNILYKDSYAAIRKFYPTMKIVIIDDNSDKNILEEIQMENVEIIESEYPGAGEFLPYYYLLTRKFFKKAICIQDSMMVNTMIPYNDVKDFMFLYELGIRNTIHYDMKRQASREVTILINNTNIPNEMMEYYKDFKWVGCFGSCMVITLEFLEGMENRLGITKWISIINKRNFRIGLERAIGIVCSYMQPKRVDYSLFGNIIDSQVARAPIYSFYDIEKYLKDKTYLKDKIIKVFNSR